MSSRKVDHIAEFYLLTLPVYLWQSLKDRLQLRRLTKGRRAPTPAAALSLFTARVMPTPKTRNGTLNDLVVAQYQRLVFADHLATCELGLFQPRKLHETDEQYWNRRATYLKSEHDLRIAIANRLN